MRFGILSSCKTKFMMQKIIEASAFCELCPTHPRNCRMNGHLWAIISWFILANPRIIGSAGISLHKRNNPRTEISLRRTMTVTSESKKRKTLHVLSALRLQDKKQEKNPHTATSSRFISPVRPKIGGCSNLRNLHHERCSNSRMKN